MVDMVPVFVDYFQCFLKSQSRLKQSTDLHLFLNIGTLNSENNIISGYGTCGNNANNIPVIKIDILQDVHIINLVLDIKTKQQKLKCEFCYDLFSPFYAINKYFFH